MDHHDHSHHGGGHTMPMPGDGMDMGPQCNMNMLFTWDTTNLCIIFRSWRIDGQWSLLWSLVAIAAMTAGYEAVRELARRYETRIATRIEQLPHHDHRDDHRDDILGDPAHTPQPRSYSYDERSSLLGTLGAAVPAEEQKAKVIKAAFYGVQVFYSFFIMLLFMTYNGWVMLAVGVGAFIGFLAFGNSTATKSAACH